MSLGERHQPEEFTGRLRCDRGPGLRRRRDVASGLGGGRRLFRRGAELLQVAAALGQRVHVAPNLLHLRELDARARQQVEAHWYHDLALDQEVVIEDEAIDGRRDRAFDGVFQGHEAQVDRSVGHRAEDVGDGATGDGLDVTERRDGLVTERALRPR